jgi:hypothetical protein
MSHNMTPLELQQQRESETARLKAEDEAHRTKLMKDRARAAFLSNPGATEDEFEAAYPSLRNAMLRTETIKALSNDDAATVGDKIENPDGTSGVRW